MISDLRINPKDYKLKANDEILKKLKPYFEISFDSHYESIQSQKAESDHSTSLKTGKSFKVHINLTLRDAKSGEFLGKGTLDYEPKEDQPEKFEEKVKLFDILGNDIGEATVEIIQKKEKPISIEDDFRAMRKEISHMMRQTRKIFDRFNRGLFGSNWGFGLLGPETLMLEDEDSYESENESDRHRGIRAKKIHKLKGKGHKLKKIKRSTVSNSTSDSEQKKDKVDESTEKIQTEEKIQPEKKPEDQKNNVEIVQES